MKKMPPLNPDEKQIIHHKATEKPFTGKYLHHKEKGTYLCRNCGASLYSSADKFDAGCGWPSFDDTLPEAVQRDIDADGVREEITCSACGGHLGHVFEGEGFTAKNTRYCVNSLSIHFEPEEKEVENPGTVATAVFGGGCFWGLEYLFFKVPGVVNVISGYSGGLIQNPTYKEVCSGQSGHAEVVQVTYDSSIVTYKELAKLFFEFHDPTQKNRQEPDIGSQYRSILFYNTKEEQETALELIELLKKKGYPIVTEVMPKAPFYPAEEYHQQYLQKHQGRACHLPVKRFEE